MPVVMGCNDNCVNIFIGQQLTEISVRGSNILTAVMIVEKCGHVISATLKGITGSYDPHIIQYFEVVFMQE
jgi:hypothetical protein